MTTWNATLDKILTESRSLTPGRVAFTLVTMPFFVIGWIVGLVFVALGLLWSAGVVGFRQARDVQLPGG